MIGIGVVGYGYWGPNLVRNFAEAKDSHVTMVADLREDRLTYVKARYPVIETTTDFKDLLKSSKVDAVAIATPVSTHYDLALATLKAGKHVLVEKPLPSNSEQGRRLVEEAAKRNLLLMVDHTFIFTGAVRKIRDVVASGDLGDVYYYDSVRVNLGLFQHDVNVVWDLAVHDLSILDFVLSSKPRAVSATGMSHIRGEPENVAYITVFFDGNLIAHINVNWLAPVKIRRTLIGGSRKMIVYDDLEPSEKVKVYDKGIVVNQTPESLYKLLVGYRSGDMWAPNIDMTEALRDEASHFVRCIETSSKSDTDGVVGLRVVELLEAASKSIAERGRVIELK